MKHILRRGTLSALLALAVLPAVANAAFTPTVSLSTVTAGCGPQGAFGFPAPGPTAAQDLAASPGYVYNITAIVGGNETNPCVNVTVPVAASNTADSALLQWLSVPGATQYKIYRNNQTLAAAPSASVCPGVLAAGRCVFQDTGALTPAGAAPPALPAASTQAGSSPDLRISQAFDYGGVAPNTPTPNSDDPAPDGTATSASLRTNILHFPSGLAANPTATTTKCKLLGSGSLLGARLSNDSSSADFNKPDTGATGTRDPNEDTCPRSSQVGTVVAVIQTATGPSIAGGDIYLGERLGSETARLYVALRPPCSAGSPVAPGSASCQAALGGDREVDKSFLSARATLKQGTNQVVTIDNDTTSIASGADEQLAPASVVRVRTTGSKLADSPIQVRSITQTLFGKADQGTAASGDDTNFILMPTSCAAETFGVDASSYLDPANVGASAALQATGCDTVPFGPTISAKLIGSPPTDTAENAHPGFEATLAQAPGEAAQKKAVVTLPQGLGTNITAVGNACSQAELASAGGCPADSQVGTVDAKSPLVGNLAGPVYLVQSPVDGQLPQLSVNLNGDGAAIKLTGGISFNADNTRLINTFDNIPDTPLSSFKLTITGGPNGLLSVGRDLCVNGLGSIDAEFTGQNGKVTNRTEGVASELDSCSYYYVTTEPTPKAKKPTLKVALRNVKKGRPTVGATIRRGGSNKRDNLRRTTFTLPKGMKFAKGAKKRIVVKVNGKKTQKFTVKGRALKSNQSKSTVRTIAIATKKGAIKESKKIRNKGKKQKLTFRLRQKVQGGRTFTITKKVKPRS
jgi:hypothetical protein